MSKICEGRYCCFVVRLAFLGGEMEKWPPLSLSRIRAKTEGESNSGLVSVSKVLLIEEGFSDLPAHHINSAICGY